jgi:hypothetical protein
MIIREVIQILNDTIYRNYSDKGVYIRNKTTGVLYSDVNSCIDYEYRELTQAQYDALGTKDANTYYLITE